MNSELQAALVAVVAGGIFELAREGWKAFSKRRLANGVAQRLQVKALAAIDEADWNEQGNPVHASNFYRRWRECRANADRLQPLVYDHATDRHIDKFIRISTIIGDSDKRLYDLRNIDPFAPQAFIVATLAKAELSKFNEW